MCSSFVVSATLGSGRRSKCRVMIHEVCIVQYRKHRSETVAASCPICRRHCPDLTPVQQMWDRANELFARGSYTDSFHCKNWDSSFGNQLLKAHMKGLQAESALRRRGEKAHAQGFQAEASREKEIRQLQARHKRRPVRRGRACKP